MLPENILSLVKRFNDQSKRTPATSSSSPPAARIVADILRENVVLKTYLFTYKRSLSQQEINQLSDACYQGYKVAESYANTAQLKKGVEDQKAAFTRELAEYCEAAQHNLFDTPGEPAIRLTSEPAIPGEKRYSPDQPTPPIGAPPAKKPRNTPRINRPVFAAEANGIASPSSTLSQRTSNASQSDNPPVAAIVLTRNDQEAQIAALQAALAQKNATIAALEQEKADSAQIHQRMQDQTAQQQIEIQALHQLLSERLDQQQRLETQILSLRNELNGEAEDRQQQTEQQEQLESKIVQLNSALEKTRREAATVQQTVQHYAFFITVREAIRTNKGQLITFKVMSDLFNLRATGGAEIGSEATRVLSLLFYHAKILNLRPEIIGELETLEQSYEPKPLTWEPTSP